MGGAVISEKWMNHVITGYGISSTLCITTLNCSFYYFNFTAMVLYFFVSFFIHSFIYLFILFIYYYYFFFFFFFFPIY